MYIFLIKSDKQLSQLYIYPGTYQAKYKINISICLHYPVVLNNAMLQVISGVEVLSRSPQLIPFFCLTLFLHGETQYDESLKVALVNKKRLSHLRRG